ncbi:hypothetical protein B0O80DRAFT_429247 [Mortierella sp. GBAus27b]|nr:hypothetical protein B0O80DRAFT_429247 [Mortierella sp. GBAus27b]
MSTDTATPPVQKFRCPSTDQFLKIATHLDSETGKHFVLWKDIQVGFKNADSIRDGETLVPFLKDSNWEEITPLRIAYHPGTVLDVILDGHNREHSQSHSHDHIELYPNASSTIYTPWEIYHSTSYMPLVTTETATCTPPVTVTFEDSNTDNISLVLYSPNVDGSHSSSVVVSNPQPNPSLREVMSAQVDLKAVVQQSFDRQSNQIQALQDQLTLTSNELTKTTAKLVKKQEQMNEMQKMALDRLANIQSRVQAVVTQTYELHEYPIPRLFIVLPKNTGVFDKIKNPFATQFRLYYLCECGTHTMDENSKTAHEIHLAKHEGYDLEKPNEFFERYGPYILTLMNMIKYGITAAGCVVSPLSSLKIVEGIDTIQEHMKFVKEHIAPLVDSTIDFLDGLNRKTDSGEELAEGHTEFDQLEALEGADLRQLESYLKVKDKGRALANLYRIVTTEGHVKWVCFDHYKSTYRQSAVQQLREIVEVNRGTFVEETGGIEIKIATSTLAKQFYDAMIKARGIQELEITLEWDATMSDIRSLANAISKANVVHVSVDGSYFKSAPLDVVNRGQRFNPILQLASKSRIQSLRLNDFDVFFSRITRPSLAPASRLRIFKCDAPLTLKDKDLQTAFDFLGCCSALTTLEMNLHPQHSILKTTSEILRKAQTLESLKISREDVMVIAGNTKRMIQGVNMSMQPPADFVLHESNATQNEHLTWMTIRMFPETEVDRLADVIRGISSLKYLRIGCYYTSSLAVIDRVISTREKIVQDTGSSCLQTFELMKEDLIPFSTISYYGGDRIQSHISFQDDSNVFDMQTWIYWSGDTALEFVRRYGWSIAFYDGGFQEHVSSSDILNGFGDTKTLQLESLRIQPHKADADVVDQIIQRSPNFKALGLYMDLIFDDGFTAAQTLLSRHAPILSALSVKNEVFDGEGGWEWFVSSFPTRDTLPALEVFEFSGFDPPSKCIPWIVAMVSAPSQQPISPSQPIIQDIIDSQVTNLESVAQRPLTRLKRIDLSRLHIQTEEWTSVIKAIDFSELQILNFFNSNLPLEGLRLLVDCIPDNASLKTLDISGIYAISSSDRRPLLDTLGRKAPSLAIMAW